MESPFNRPVAVNLIQQAIEQWNKDIAKGYIGFSLEMFIYDTLKQAGYLTPQALESSKL